MRKRMTEPTDDGKHVAWVLLGILVAALVICPFLWSESRAVVTGDVVTLDVHLNLGTDSSNYAVDSVVFRGFYRRGASARWTWLGKGSKCVITTAPDNSTQITDSLCWNLEVPADSFLSISGNYAWLHSFAAWVYWDARGVDQIEVENPLSVRQVYLVDSLEQDCGSGGGGSGTGAFADSIYVLSTVDSTPIGAGATVWLTPNAGGPRLNAVTNSNGLSVFSVDTDTFLVLLWSVGWQQAVVPDTNRVPGVGVTDTVYMTAITPTPAASPSLTPVTFTFFNGIGAAIKNVRVLYQLDSKYAAYHMRDSSITIDPSQWFETRSNSSGVATIQVTPNDSILVLGGKTGQTKWRVKAYTPDGLTPLLGNDGVTLDVVASQVSWYWPQDFE